MKKLLIAMGCVAAVILTSSCTTDSLEGQENTNNSKNYSTKPNNSLNISNSILLDTGGDDKDKVKV
ncbi:hypothetical protein ACM55F_14320 [Flavobacterium sp. XS2P12]|uniref:hypothetical protein n=1 Tax=Flavobacterium melibiosi TaxID=3398734 RepID=UPI003A8B26FB